MFREVAGELGELHLIRCEAEDEEDMSLVGETGGDAEQVEEDLREDSRKERKLDEQKALKLSVDGMCFSKDVEDVSYTVALVGETGGDAE